MSERSDSERLAVIEATLTTLSNRLLGSDGNGGELDALHKRVGKLENWRWWVVGLAVGLGAAFGGVAKAAIDAFGSGN